MAAAVVPLLIAGTAMSTFGALKQGRDNAEIAGYNAQVAERDAQTVEAQGAEEARRSLVNSRKMVGAAQAAYGASGVTQDGSAQWVLRNSAAQGELNALTIKNNADVKATAYRNEAGLDVFRGQNYQTDSYINAASSLLKGGAKIADLG